MGETNKSTGVLRLDYDDLIEDVLEDVNVLLQAHGLQFVNDGYPHDGYEIYTLTKVSP